MRGRDPSPRALESWGLALLLALVAGACVVPALAATDPLAIDDVLLTRLTPPLARDGLGRYHLLGTDAFGRDMLVRMMLAGRVSLSVGVAGSLLAAVVGVVIGASAGWLGGVVDRLSMGLADVLLAVPRLVALLVCAALWGPGIVPLMVVLTATGWMGVARLVRAEVMGARARPVVDAARALGASDRGILWRHVLPPSLSPAVVAATLGVGGAVLLESGLSFLGLGVQPPRPSWGNMIAGGRELMTTAPWVALLPGILLILTTLACTLIGDGLQQRLTPDSTHAGSPDSRP